MTRIKSQGAMEAILAGRPGEAEITISPKTATSFIVGYPIDKPTPVRAPCVPNCLNKTY